MTTYVYFAPPEGVPAFPMVQRSDDGAFIPCSLENRDYQEFLSWMAEGNPAPAGWSGPTNATPATG